MRVSPAFSLTHVAVVGVLVFASHLHLLLSQPTLLSAGLAGESTGLRGYRSFDLSKRGVLP